MVVEVGLLHLSCASATRTHINSYLIDGKEISGIDLSYIVTVTSGGYCNCNGISLWKYLYSEYVMPYQYF